MRGLTSLTAQKYNAEVLQSIGQVKYAMKYYREIIGSISPSK